MPASPIPAYIQEIANRHQRDIAAERSYYGDLETLMKQLLPGVEITVEPRRRQHGMPDFIPDFVLTRDSIPLGYIEAKDVGKSLDDNAYRDQLRRYLQSLDNFIFTNYLEFRFYRDNKAKPVAEVSIAGLHGGKIAPLPQNFARFTDLVKTFGAWSGQPISTADDLAARMADKARLLADVIESALAEENGVTDSRSLEAQLQAFRKFLISDISIAEFAGVYAQTIAYGMFAARLHDPLPADFSRRKAAELIPDSTPFLGKFFGYIADLDLDERIRWIVDDLADIFRATDVGGLMKGFGKATRRTDPFLHFYETFLGKYDKKLRKGRGVYYTPEPAVKFIVRAVDEILKTEFGLSGGLADTEKTLMTADGAKKKVHRVQILEPATGTGTFLAETVKCVHEKFAAQKGAWPGYVKRELLPRLNGFEILMAPYAMAHLKLEMVLRGTGCELDGERLRIFLTNSLEEHHPGTDTLFASWLADESREANEIKRDVPLMVVMGNPPYAVSSSNSGAWIQNLLEVYKQGLKEKKINLDDDYIKFIRYGEYLIERNGEGVLAYISNNSFIDGITHRRMRRHLLETFDRIYILNLHGDSRRKERSPDGSPDQNVFDIMQGVAINIYVKSGKKKKTGLGEVLHCDVFGKRESKYEFLWEHGLDTIDFRKLETPAPYFFFVPKDFSAQAEYENGFAVNALFEEYNSGIQTKRDNLTVAISAEEIEKIKKDMEQLGVEEVREKYRLPADGRDWTIAWAKKDVEESGPQTVSILYRPFDARKTLYTGKTKGFLAYPRHKTMRQMLAGDNLGFMTSRSYPTVEVFDRVFITRHIADIHAASDQTYFFPLYLFPDEEQSRLDGEVARKPNLNAGIAKEIADKIGMTFTPEKTAARNTLAPLDLLDYIYATLHSPAYREKFREFLKIDFPRVPYPDDQKHFRALAKLGAELRALHLMESAKLDKLITTYPETGDNTVTRRILKDDYEITAPVKRIGKVWINDTQYFGNIPQIAWDFPVGGYHPAQKYLKDRKDRILSWDEITHYQKIIVALVETEKVMKKIDEIN